MACRSHRRVSGCDARCELRPCRVLAVHIGESRRTFRSGIRIHRSPTITITNLGTNRPLPDRSNGNQSETCRAMRVVSSPAMRLAPRNAQRPDAAIEHWAERFASRSIGKMRVRKLRFSARHDCRWVKLPADQQEFRVGNAGGGTCANEPTASYNVNLVPPANVVLGGFGVSWGNPAPVAVPGCPSPTLGGTCSAGASATSALCNIKYTLPQASTLAITGFNRGYAGTPETWTCTKNNGQTISGTYTPEMCTNLQVLGVTAGLSPVTFATAVVANDGKPSELVNISVLLLQPATDVVVTFGQQAAPRNAGYQCNAGNNAAQVFLKKTCSD